MDRRDFVGGLACLVVAKNSRGQAAAVHRVGFLLGATAESVTSLFGALKEGMRDLGYVEGRTVVYEARFGGGKMEKLPELATELVRLRVEVIVTGTNFHVAAVKRATTTIPVVMVFAADPVGAGFVESLARPGGNITGLSSDASPELWAKYLTLLRDVAPRLTRVGMLGQMSSRVGVKELEAASRTLDIGLEIVDLKSAEGIDEAFETMVRRRVDAAVITVGPLTYQLRQRIGDLALKHRLPAITDLSEYAQAGLLLSYGPNLLDLYKRAASYVDKILRGARPADLPVEQPSKFELTINLKTAKALGLSIPPSLRTLAADLIE